VCSYAGGVRALSAALVLLAALTLPSSATALQKAMWGPTELNGQPAFPIYRDLGVDIYEASVNWRAVAPTRPANPTDPADPAYRWPPSLDDTMTQAAANGIAVQLAVMWTPGWANGDKPGNWAPDDARDYADFMTAVARRYPSVHRWMVWAEPCRGPNFQPLTYQEPFDPLTSEQKRQPRRYAELVDAAYGALKGLSPSNVVIGGNTWSVCDIRPPLWAKYMKLPNGRRPRLDMWGHNPYTKWDAKPPAPAAQFVDMRDLRTFERAVDRAFGRHIPLFISEFTIPTAPDVDFDYYVSEKEQARLIGHVEKLLRHAGVHNLGWIFPEDTPPGAGGKEGHNGGLLRANGTRKPAYRAFKRV
jgi:hypothetical protein